MSKSNNLRILANALLKTADNLAEFEASCNKKGFELGDDLLEASLNMTLIDAGVAEFVINDVEHNTSRALRNVLFEMDA